MTARVRLALTLKIAPATIVISKSENVRHRVSDAMGRPMECVVSTKIAFVPIARTRIAARKAASITVRAFCTLKAVRARIARSRRLAAATVRRVRLLHRRVRPQRRRVRLLRRRVRLLVLVEREAVVERVERAASDTGR
jgi:hypothetical protein